MGAMFAIAVDAIDPGLEGDDVIADGPGAATSLRERAQDLFR